MMMRGVRTPAPSLLHCALPPTAKPFCRSVSPVQCSSEGTAKSPQCNAAMLSRREILLQSAVLALGELPHADFPCHYTISKMLSECCHSLAASQAFGLALQCEPAAALPGFKKDLNKRKKGRVPESEFKDGPQGLKYARFIV